MKKGNWFFAPAATALAVAALAGCSVQQIRQDQTAVADEAQAKLDNAPTSRPAVRIHDGAWLMGEKIRASKAQPEIFSKQVVFNGTIANLNELANWIAQNVGVRATVEASALSQTGVTAQLPAPTGPARNAPLPSGAQRVSDLNSPLPAAPAFGSGAIPLLPAGAAAGLGNAAVQQPLTVRYSGTLKGFLEVVNAHFGVWHRYRDGTVSFFRTETRTLEIPTLADSSTMWGGITTDGASTSPSNVAGGAPSQPSNSSLSGSGSGGQSMTLSATVNPWATLQETAAAVAGAGAQIVADKNLNLLTVTGTPAQCDRVEELVRKLDAMYGKQVAIDVHIYSVRLTREENYGLNLSLALASPNGHTGITFSGATPPTVLSTSSPMKFGASIMGGRLNGSSAAVQALSALGDVSQLVSRAGVTQNGKVLALQSATPQNIVSQTQTTLASNVGATTSVQTSTLVPGFTANFLPKVINGRILVDFSMTLSQLLSLQTFTSGSGSNQSSVQLPTLQLARFEQSVSLKPGETLVLTGARQHSASVTGNGVGSPWMPLLGGGVDAQKGDTILAVVVTARLL